MAGTKLCLQNRVLYADLCKTNLLAIAKLCFVLQSSAKLLAITIVFAYKVFIKLLTNLLAKLCFALVIVDKAAFCNCNCKQEYGFALAITPVIAKLCKSATAL